MSEQKQTTKGLEEEVYTGTPEGEVIGLSQQIEQDLDGFECEPDNRNAEFGTHPHRSYAALRKELIEQRMKLRAYLKEQGDLTLIPGGALSLGDTGVFCRSHPDKDYHAWIENAYGTDVVTASNHINVGIPDPEEIIRAFRVIRCDAALFLALTASSPFLNGKNTGYHSYRWHMFPKTPKRVPLFENFGAYRTYVSEHLSTGVMQNSRHLWLSTRPNGHDVPNEVDRLELRVCDRIDDVEQLMAITALFEARIWHILEHKHICPLASNRSPEELITVIDANEEAVSRDGLDAEIICSASGKQVQARACIERWLKELGPVFEAYELTPWIEPVYRILDEGSVAMQWMAMYNKGVPIREIIQEAIRRSAEKDLEASRSI